MQQTFSARVVLTNSVLLVVSVLCMLAFAELIARFLYSSPIGTPWQHRVPHPIYGWSLKPEQEYLYVLPEGHIPVNYNANGYRDEPHTIDAGAEDISRLIVLGDSFVEGYSVELEHVFYKVLERLLNSENQPTHAINLGVGGYGTLQQYLVLSDYGLSLKPDIVLLGFHLGNDFRNNLFELEQAAIKSDSEKIKSRPFLLSANDDQLQISPVAFEAAQRRYELESAEINSGWKRFRQWFRTVDIAALVHNRFQLSKSQTLHENGSSVTKQFVDYGMHYCDEDPLFAESLRVTKQVLAAIKSQVESVGSRFVVFSVPARREVDLEAFASADLNPAVRDATCMRGAPGYQRLFEVLDSLDIEFIDLLNNFRQQQNIIRQNSTKDSGDKLALFRRSDLHWAPEGHALAARVVATYLQANPAAVIANSETAE